MSIIIPANSAVGGGIEGNSCRFNDGSSDYLNRTNVSSVTNNQKFTLSQWVKRGALGTTQRLYGMADNSPGTYAQEIYSIDAANTITYQHRIAGSDVSYKSTTNMLFRDVGAWYHIVLAVDTTQGTDTNRVKIYVNGTQVSTTQGGYPSTAYIPQNNPVWFNHASLVNQLGALAGNSTFDGYMAEVVMIDGTQLAPTSFGQFNGDSGVWQPIDVSGLTFGNNGFYLDFEDSSALGNDAAGSNNWTTNNLTAIDQTTDSPTNNFATLNSIDNYYAGGTFSEGNLQVISVNTGYTYNTSTFGGATGKWYWEVKWSAQPTGSTNQVQIGIAKRVAASATTWLGSQAYTYGYQGSSGHVQVSDGNASGSVATTYAIGDIISVAMDLDNNKIHFAKNGTYTNSSDPAANSGGVTITAPDSTSGDSGFYFAAFGDGNNSLQETGQFNFGAGPPYAISSGNADGNGYGNFEYAPPSGFLSLCTANLSEVNS